MQEAIRAWVEWAKAGTGFPEPLIAALIGVTLGNIVAFVAIRLADYLDARRRRSDR